MTDQRTSPFVVFYAFSAGSKQTKVKFVDQDGQPGEVDATEYPMLEFVFYGSNKCQLHDYGKTLVARDTEQLDKRTDEERKRVIVGGYFDGPIPFPIQNFVGQRNSGTERHDIGYFDYGTVDGKDSEFGTETGWSFGFESEGKTTEGIGPAYKVS